MVLQLQFWRRNRLETLIPWLKLILFSFAAESLTFVCPSAFAAEPSGATYLNQAAQFYRSGQYFRSARYAFAATQQDAALKPNAYSWITLGLLHAGLPNAASYFFIRTLQSGNSEAIRAVLTQTQQLLVIVGSDVLKKYLIRHTHYEDYDSTNRSAYLYALGKDTLISGDPAKAIGYLDGIDRGSPLWPFSLQLRGSAYALLNKNEEAVDDFKSCASHAGKIVGYQGDDPIRLKQSQRESEDLKARCMAGQGRTLYQMQQFADADQTYDDIPKKSFVWPDILFEQAWNSYALREYNRTLGRLVSYKSPALSFMFNTEVDVLRAQAFLALCLYSDANEVVNQFNSKYSAVGEEVKMFVEKNANNMDAFYSMGKSALQNSIYTKNNFYRLQNRFIRGPYFQNIVANERQVSSEMAAIRSFDSKQSSVSHQLGEGFPGFLEQVLKWRLHSIRYLGGAFVKNSLIDYHATLIDDFEKMAFIKLEMLKRAKDKLLYKKVTSSEDRSRGSVEPTRHNNEYYWSFNGEFWNDELGDYVFGLESECQS